eukprot:18359-Eustigmatos_ZCMA.PRE.1
MGLSWASRMDIFIGYERAAQVPIVQPPCGLHLLGQLAVTELEERAAVRSSSNIENVNPRLPFFELAASEQARMRESMEQARVRAEQAELRRRRVPAPGSPQQARIPNSDHING